MAKYDAYGTLLYRGTSGGGTAIAQIRTITGPGLTADTIDVTSMDSTAGYEEVVVGILRTGEITFGIVYDPADATHKNAGNGLLADFVGRASTTYTIVFPDTGSTEWVVTAFVTAFSPTMPHDGSLDAAVTLKPTGQPTLA